MADAWVQIGVVRSVQPGRRAVRVAVRPAWARLLKDAAWLALRAPDGAVTRHKVAQAEAAGGDWVMTLSAGTPREAVGQMRGVEVVVAADQAVRDPGVLPEAADVVDFAVADSCGAVLGTVAEAYDAGGVVIAVRPLEGSRFHLPLSPQVLESVDWNARTIRVRNAEEYKVAGDED